MAAEPELLYVNSKITNPSKLSTELFTSWYNDVHIPDIFKTSGIKQAYRYFTSADKPETIDRPYLALYPVKSKGYMQSPEFAAIPIRYDTLPGPDHIIFSVADFDVRYYNFSSNFGPRCFQAPYLLTVQIESLDKSEGDVEKLIQNALGTDVSMRLYRCYFSRQNRLPPEANQLGAPSSDLALLWFDNKGDLDNASSKAQKLGHVAMFTLLKALSAS